MVILILLLWWLVHNLRDVVVLRLLKTPDFIFLSEP